MTPRRLFRLMSTHVKEIATPSNSSGALDWDPPCSQQPGSRGDGAWSRRPSPAPNFPQLQAHLSRRKGGPALGGAREVAEASSCRGAPVSPPAAGPNPRPGPPGPPPSSARPLGNPQPSGSPSRLSAQELRSGAGPELGPGRRLLRPEGSLGRLMPQAWRPPPPGAQPLTCRRRRRSTLLPGGAPTRPGCGPLRSPPGQARGGAGASPKRRNPPPGQPPPAPGSTRGRAGEGGARRPQIPGLAYRARRPTRARARAAAGGAGPASWRRTKAKGGAGGPRPGREVGARSAGGHSGAARRAGGVGTAGAQDPPPAP